MQERRIDLSGEWKVTLQDGELAGTSAIVTLPGSLDEAMIGTPVTEHTANYLNRRVCYDGAVRYERTVTVPEAWRKAQIRFTMERSRYTQVYVDGVLVGDDRSLSCPQTYDLSCLLTPGTHTLEIVVDNSRDVMGWQAVRFSHIAVDHTQTCWLGILGEIFLEARPKQSIERVFVDAQKHLLDLAIDIENAGEEAPSELQIALTEQAVSWRVPVELKEGRNTFHYQFALEIPLKPWSEFHPELYHVQVALAGPSGEDSRTEQFGVCHFARDGKHLTVNGHRTFLRGRHDGAVFPLTGYAPMDEASWIKNFSKAKEFGINHYRFHSWCPPEAAFRAADKCGIYLQPELPHWDPSSAFRKDEEWAYYQEEARRILGCYGNHPSFVMFAWGNELSGDEKRMEELVERCRRYDPRRLYSIGSNNFFGCPHEPHNSDFWPTFWTQGEWNSAIPERGGLGVRGSTPHHTRGHINNVPPNTQKTYDNAAARVNLPIIGHEVGQYQSFPDFKEISKYTGVLNPANLELFRSKMEQNGQFPLAEMYAMASGKLAVQCYREEIEAALRTADFSGFQLLDLQDYPGQGTALVGVLDSFMEEKCFTDAVYWRQFCAPTILLLKFPRYVWCSGQEVPVEVLAAHYGEKDFSDTLCLSLSSETGTEIAKIKWKAADIPAGKLTSLVQTAVRLPECASARRLNLTATLLKSGIQTQYPVWCYPYPKEADIPQNVYVTQNWDIHARRAAERGKRVLWMPRAGQLKSSVSGAFIPDFWCYPMFKKYNPPGTLGLLCDPEHPALRDFPTDFHSDWQWWNLVKSANPMVLDGLPGTIIVRVIDNIARQYQMALLVEGIWNRTPVLICSIPLLEQLDRPEAYTLYQSLLRYAGSDDFTPVQELSDKFFELLQNRTPEDLVLENRNADIFG